jgi:hypothetical protein
VTQTASANQILLSNNWHAFRRDFTNWYEPPPAVLVNDVAAINRAFPVGRLIRLRLTNNLYHFARLTQAVTIPAGAPSSLTLTFAQPVVANCLSALDGAFLAPVSLIRYLVRNPAPGTLDLARDEATGRMAQLFREEVSPLDKVTAFGNNTRAILDFVVGFNLEFTLTDDTPPGSRDEYDVDETTTLPASLTNANQRIRSVIVDLAVRTPEQDPTFPWLGAECGPQRCYRVFDDRPGAARVRRMRSEVFVPNIANEGY